MFAVDDLDVFYAADFGAVEITHRPASGGAPVVGLALLDQPGRDAFSGAVSGIDYTMRTRVAVFPGLSRGDRITIAGVDYRVRDTPDPTPDGLEAVSALVKE